MQSPDFENNFNDLQKRIDLDSDEDEPVRVQEEEESSEFSYESIYVKIGKEVKQELFRGSKAHMRDSRLEIHSNY